MEILHNGQAKTKHDTVEIYHRNSKNYDFITKLYRLIGININKYRRMAVDTLRLKEGDMVIEIGCGTGLNFELIQEQIGPKGKIIGVDVTDGMLDQARHRLRLKSWDNVELICSDAVTFQFPQEADAIISTGVFGYIDNYDKVICDAAEALVSGGRFVILDGRKPSNWRSILMPLFLSVTGSFGVNRMYLSHETEQSFKHYFTKTETVELYGGFIYLLMGEK